MIVADGAGGIAGGGPAAELALAILAERIRDALRSFSARGRTRLSRPMASSFAIVPPGVATCVVVALAPDGRVVGASCGDSRAVVVMPGATLDDLTARQKPKLRLGSGRALPVSFARPALEGMLVLATDGLFNYAKGDDIAAIAQSGEHDLDAIARRLVECVRLPRGTFMDDIAVVVVGHVR